jgi:hypothetical protein
MTALSNRPQPSGSQRKARNTAVMAMSFFHSDFQSIMPAVLTYL